MFKKTLLTLTLLALSLTACRPKTTASEQSQINAAVVGTLAAQPKPTAHPTCTPYPTPTPQTLELRGLFCEYQFCIGHPAELALFDARDPKAPSNYSEGMLAAYRADHFMLVIWQLRQGVDDPQFMINNILQDGVDSRRGNLDVSLVGELTTFYSTISNTASEALPSGAVAAWICGDRAFGWKVYTENEDTARLLFEESISKFRCVE